MLYPLDHPAFAANKHIRINPAVTVTFPLGSGGNFLIGQLNGRYDSVNIVTNEYKADAVYLGIEELFQGFETDGGMQIANDDLANYARVIGNRWSTVPRDFMYCHGLPVITSLMFDYHTDELIHLTVHPIDAWYVAMLDWVKNRNGSMVDSWRVGSAINHALSKLQHPVNHVEYDTAWHVLRRAGCIDLKDSLSGWQYFIDCTQRGDDPLDKHNLRAWISDDIIGKLEVVSHENTDQISTARSILTRCCKQVNTTDYATLFWDLNTPKNSALAQIDVRQIRDYTLRNMQLISNLLPNISDELSTVWNSRLDEAQARLRMACIRHDIALNC